MKKYLTIFVCLLSALFFAACQKQDTSVSKTGFYFDTVIKVTLYDADAEPELESCFALADKYEKLLSATKKGSDIWNINHANGQPVTVDSETASLLQTALYWSEKKLFPCFKKPLITASFPMVPLISRSANSLLFGILVKIRILFRLKKTLMPHFLPWTIIILRYQTIP